MDGLCDSEDSGADGEIMQAFTGKSDSVSELFGDWVRLSVTI